MELRKDTMGGLLEKWATETPDKKFIIYHDRNLCWTYREFNERVDLFAKGLMELGVTKDSKVGIWANNIPDWLTVFFASAKLGAWLVTVNTSYKAAELDYLLEDSDIHTLCIIDKYRDSSYVDMVRGLDRSHLPYLKNVVVMDGAKADGFLCADDVFEKGRNANDLRYLRMKEEVDCHDIVNMQYTSGTTGFPKGVMLTHFNILNNGQATGDAMVYTPDDKLCVCVPFFHCFGIVLALCSVITHNMTMVITVDFEAEAVLRSVSAEKCTALYGVPTMFVSELNHENFSKYDLSSLRTGIMAGSLCPIETMKQVMDKMNMKDIISVYGLTESSPGMTCSRTFHTMEQRATTVGTEFPEVEVKVFNPETGRECAIGEHGEICCRGYNVMKGYYKNPKATAETIDADGWLHSGDLAMKDEEGFYHITGRIKDMIIRGGENIYPREIENFIYKMPEVRMVEVVGIPDPKYGEIVGAFIILKEGCTLTQEQVQEYCKGQIARYKIPKYIFFVDDYPKTGSGKVQKFKLRDIAKANVDKILAEEAAQK
ncbi:MAG: AMP-binding protein [Bacteroidales bacterium]|nr:AMP-binding protein [Bacteroidales bacterium]